MCRGTAVEHGVNYWIEQNGDCYIDDVIKEALKKYDEEMSGIIAHMTSVYSKEVDDIRYSIPELCRAAINHYDNEFDFNFSKPEMQVRMDLVIPGLKRKVVGYMDYLVKDQCVRDCKVVKQTPSKLKQAYKIQGALYRKFTGLNVTFDFIIDNKKAVTKSISMTDEDYSFGLAYAKKAGQVLEELEESTDPKRIIELMAFPNLEAIWNPEERRDCANHWGIM